MGRGTGTGNGGSIRDAAGSAAVTPQTIRIGEWANHGHDPRGTGEILTLADGGTMTIDAATPALFVRGLTMVDGIARRPDGLFFVRFTDGTTALLDLERLELALSDGTISTTDPRVYGAIAAALASAGNENDPRFAELQALFARLQDDPSDPDTLAAAARLAEQLAAGLGGKLTVGSQQLGSRLAVKARRFRLPTENLSGLRQRRPLLAHMAAARSAAENVLGPDIADEEWSEQMTQLKRLVYGELAAGTDQNGEMILEPNDLDPAKQAERIEAARRIGAEIPRGVVDQTHMTREMLTAFTIAAQRWALGYRGFALVGPPGSGKDTFGKVFAEVSGMGLRTFDFGLGSSLHDSLGGEGLVPVDVLDENNKKVNTINVSGVLVGPLARAMKEPCVIMMDECVEGDLPEQLTALHSAIGSDVGHSERYLVIHSPSFDREPIPVHPDCTLIFTWNPGLEDRRIKDSTLSRLVTFYFDYGDTKDSAEMFAKMVNNVLQQADADFPELKNYEWSGDDLQVFAEIFQSFYNAHQNDSGQIPQMPTPRNFVGAFLDLALEAANNLYDNNDDSEDAARRRESPFNMMLQPFVVYTASSLPLADRYDILQTIITDDHKKALERVCEKVMALVDGADPAELAAQSKPDDSGAGS